MRLEVVLRGHAQRVPDRPAVICGTERISYKDLVASAAGLAAALGDLGVRSGDRVVLYLANCVAFVELMYATFMLGAIAVPVSTRLTANELNHICADSRPKVFVLDEGSRAVAAELGPVLADAVLIVRGTAAGAVPLDELRGHAVTARAPLANIGDDALIMYTSGTTGRPKGAIITHANMVTQHGFINAVESPSAMRRPACTRNDTEAKR